MDNFPSWVSVSRTSISDYQKEVLSKKVSSSYSAYKLMEHIGTFMHEEMYVIALDGHCHPMAISKVAEGSQSEMSCTIGKVFQIPMVVLAAGIILVHNHPSGDCTPSQEDIKFTDKIKEAGTVLSCALYDHIIIAGSTYHSMADNGYL